MYMQGVIVMKKYRVYFEQVNQTYYDVEANNKGDAIGEAVSKWMKDNRPMVSHVDNLN